MTLSLNDVRRIADLSRIELTSEEESLMQQELSSIFQMIEKIQSVDTEGVEPMRNPHDGVQRLRNDLVTETENRAENMKNAPEQAEGLFLVPQVLE